MNWFQKLLKNRSVIRPIAPVPKTESIRPIRHEMTLERWRGDDGLVNWARQSVEFAYILSVVENQQPSAFPIRGQKISDIECAIELGRREGYRDCHCLLYTSPSPRDS